VEDAPIIAPGARPIGRLGFMAGLVKTQGDEGIEQRIVALDPLDAGIDKLNHAQFALVEQGFLLDGGEETKISGVHDAAPAAMASLRRSATPLYDRSLVSPHQF
jgi:hypothetical protein